MHQKKAKLVMIVVMFIFGLGIIVPLQGLAGTVNSPSFSTSSSPQYTSFTVYWSTSGYSGGTFQTILISSTTGAQLSTQSVPNDGSTKSYSFTISYSSIGTYGFYSTVQQYIERTGRRCIEGTCFPYYYYVWQTVDVSGTSYISITPLITISGSQITNDPPCSTSGSSATGFSWTADCNPTTDSNNNYMLHIYTYGGFWSTSEAVATAETTITPAQTGTYYLTASWTLTGAVNGGSCGSYISFLYVLISSNGQSLLGSYTSSTSTTYSDYPLSLSFSNDVNSLTAGSQYTIHLTITAQTYGNAANCLNAAWTDFNTNGGYILSNGENLIATSIG